MFIKNFIKRYMEQLDAGSTSGGGVNTSTPADAAVDAPAGTAPDAQGNPEQKTAEQQADAPKDGDKPEAKAEDGKPAAKADAPQGAPEKYEFKLGEGQELDPDVQSTFEATARELNLPQEAAQKLVETMAPKIQAAQKAVFDRVQTEWETTAKADKEYGGKDFAANLSVAKAALDRFGSPELKTFLNESGLGNHPEMVRMMFKAGKAISPDKVVPGSQGNAPQRDKAKTLYPNSK